MADEFSVDKAAEHVVSLATDHICVFLEHADKKLAVAAISEAVEALIAECRDFYSQPQPQKAARQRQSGT